MKPEKFYNLYSFMSSFGMCLSVGVYIPYLILLGLSKADIFLINAIFWLTISSSEVVTGMLADGKSRAWSVRTGLLISVLGALTYATATLAIAKWQIFTIALVAEILMGIGMSFTSGAQQAWLSDALKRHGRPKDYQVRAFARSAKWGSFGMLLGGSVSFLFPARYFSIGWIVCSAILFANWSLCKLRMNGDGEPVERTTELKSLKDSWCAISSNRQLQWAALAGMMLGFVLPFNLTWVPHFTSVVETSSQSSALTAAFWILINCGLMLGNRWVEKSHTISEKQTVSIPLALFFTGVGLAALGLVNGWLLPIAFVLLHELGRGMFQPLMDGYIYSRVESSYKATYGSLQSMVSRSGFALVLFVGWWLLRGHDVNASDGLIWPVAGLCLVACATLLWIIRPRQTA
ncbi:MAG: MFS transporter [Patescibacteria group bacterium]|nr:MFS transporter [Patescibacteria group bacterium]